VAGLEARVPRHGLISNDGAARPLDRVDSPDADWWQVTLADRGASGSARPESNGEHLQTPTAAFLRWTGAQLARLVRSEGAGGVTRGHAAARCSARWTRGRRATRDAPRGRPSRHLVAGDWRRRWTATLSAASPETSVRPRRPTA